MDMSSTILSAHGEIDHNDDKVSKVYFDEVMDKIPMGKNEFLYEIINQLIETNLSYVHLIDHPIFIHIKDRFIDILQDQIDDFNLLPCIGQLLLKMTDHVDDKNIHLFEQLFVNVTLIECLCKHLKNLSPTSHTNLIDGIANMLDAYQKFQQDRPIIKDNPILLSLVMSIVNFIKSVNYKNSFFQLSVQEDKLTNFQKLILITCPKYIVSYWCTRQKEIALAAAQETLSRASEILIQFLPFISNWSKTIMWCVFYLIWLCQYSSDDYLLSAYNIQHEKILDCVLEIVQSKELWHLANQNDISSSLQKRASQLLCYATLYIYATSFSPELRHKLKENNVIPIILRLTKANYDKTKFHAYRILAVLLSSEDIKQLANPTEVTTVFITYLKKCMNIDKTRQRLENLLLSLKNLIQHDQIKAEFVKQVDGLSLLIQCATETRFDPVKVQLSAIEILMCLTFNNEAKMHIKQNNIFVEYMRSLTTTSTISRLQKAADGILWRLFSKDMQIEDDFQYDIMISYSHKDKDICYQIHQALIADNFRVWIDVEGIHGVLMQAMADAIKQSRCIIICMSDTYYLSPYCQAEAQYAFQKRRDLIPLRVQSGYKPDGWLAFLTSALMYIDFTKVTFDVAYKQLISQINQNYVCNKKYSVIPFQSNVSETAMIKHENTGNCYSMNILQWTSTDVEVFLLDKQLNQMIPICKLMDGKTLMELYKMCVQNSPVMLQTLRNETIDLKATPLSANTYLTFLREIKYLIEERKVWNIKSGFHTCILT